LPGTPDFETWQLAQREELRGHYMQLLHQHVSVSMSNGAWNTGIHSARRIITEEPWLEETHRQLIVMLARAGQRQAAVAQYQACRRILREELGVDPSLETAALFNRLRAAITPPPHNLPILASPLVGRTEQLRLLSVLLAEPACRLVTISGLSGSGKTRLALELARSFAVPVNPPSEQPFPDGIFRINLADAPAQHPVARRSAAEAARALIAKLDAVLGTPPGASADALARIKAYLSQRAMLLVLDNFEQLEPGAGVLSDLLAHAPHLKLLVTTRVPMHLPGERVLHVDGLRLPATEAELETAEASALFLQETRRVSVDFELIDAERPHLVRLCQLLGGFPLALVLAARWAPILPCSALTRELESGVGLDVLMTTDPDLPERHRSLTRILENALAQLPGDERAVAQLLEDASASCEARGRTAKYGVPRELVAQLKVLDEQALLRVDGAHGTIELHPLLRPYTRRAHVVGPSPGRAA